MYSGPGFNFSYSKMSHAQSGSDYSSQNAGVGAYFTLGYFVADNLAIGPGFDVGYSWNKSTSGSYYFQIQSLYGGVDPFIRYYFGKNIKLKPFVQSDIGVSYGLNYYKYTTEYQNETVNKFQTNTLSLNAGASAGIAYFINQVIGLECSISYNFNHEIQSSDQEGSSDIKTNNHLINLGIGFQYYFAKKPKEK